MSVTADVKHALRGARRRLFPSPAEAALRHLEHVAASVPRHTHGRVRLVDLDIEFDDAASLVPQWNDIFVRRTLGFRTGSTSPRILDCGANVGLASLWLKRAYAGARITAFEASPALAATLRRNLDINLCRDVESVAAAVWSSAGTITFRAEGSDSGAVASVAADTAGPAIEVPSVRLRDWLVAEPVDLLKLDIEGAELEVLGDCRDALGQVGAIHLEVHDFASGSRLLPRCLALLEDAGFDYTLDDLHQAPWRPGAPAAGPFPGVAAWIVLIRAWRRPR
jgi:FkbM family methyltransferase